MNRLKFTSAISLLVTLNLVSNILGEPYRPVYLTDDEDCCRLELMDIPITSEDKKFFPSAAIPFQTLENGLKYYLLVSDYFDVGLGDNRVGNECYMLRDAFRYWIWTSCNDRRVVSNPNNCIVNWKKAGQYPSETNQFYYPALTSKDKIHWNGCDLHGPIDKYYFGRTTRRYDGWTQSHVSGAFHAGCLMGLDVNYVGGYLFGPNDHEILEVDCLASLQNQFSGEVVEFRLQDDLKEEAEEIIIAQDRVTNNDDQDYTRNIELSTKVVSSLQLIKESSLAKITGSRNTHSSSHSVTVRPSGNFKLNIKGIFSIGGGVERTIVDDVKLDSEDHSSREEASKDGYTRTEQKELEYKFNKAINIRAKHQVTVSMRQKRLKGERGFIAVYRIRPEQANRKWSTRRILGSFRRLGVDFEEKDGQVVFQIRGRIKINFGLDTHVTIGSTSLESPRKINFTDLYKIEPGDPSDSQATVSLGSDDGDKVNCKSGPAGTNGSTVDFN